MKTIWISIIVVVMMIGGVFVLTQNGQKKDNITSANNVTIVDGKQIIEINAKGGYLPRASVAKANLPTIIRFKTNGTFDCSSAIRIPSMNISKILPQSGSTDIEIGISSLGVLQGSCSMGMYPFEVEFI